MGRLFGTDGARGVANSELTCELAMQIGRAAAMVLTDDTHSRPRVLIGMDTRISSEMLEAALTAGFCSVGADVLLVGVVPTPGGRLSRHEIWLRCGRDDLCQPQPLRI